MSDILLSAKNLSMRFGGVLAVNNVSFDVRKAPTARARRRCST